MFTFETPKEEFKVHRGPKVRKDYKFDTVRNDLIYFLKANPNYEGSNRLMAGELGCSYRTVHHYTTELVASGELSVQKNSKSGRRQTSFYNLDKNIELKNSSVGCSKNALVTTFLELLTNNKKDNLRIETIALFEHLNPTEKNIFLRLIKGRNLFDSLWRKYPEVYKKCDYREYCKLMGTLGEAYAEAERWWNLEYQKRRVEKAKKYGLASRVKNSRPYKKAEIIYNIHNNPEELTDRVKTIIEKNSLRTNGHHDIYDYLNSDWWLYPKSYKTWYFTKKEEVGIDLWNSKFEKYWPEPDIDREELFTSKIKKIRYGYNFTDPEGGEEMCYNPQPLMDEFVEELAELEKRGSAYIGALNNLKDLEGKNNHVFFDRCERWSYNLWTANKKAERRTQLRTSEFFPSKWESEKLINMNVKEEF